MGEAGERHMEHIFENSQWHEDRMIRKQLNEAYNALDELRMRVQVQAAVINELKGRLEAFEKLDTIAQALLLARDVIVAHEDTLNQQRLALERAATPEPLRREMSVLDP